MGARRDVTALWHRRRSERSEGRVGVARGVKPRLGRHPKLQAYVQKVRRDNLRFLVSALAWNLLVAVPEIAIGMIAVINLIFRSPSQQRVVARQISRAVQGVLKPDYLERLVHFTMQHPGITLIVGIVAVGWAADSLGCALSDCFGTMFEVRPRGSLMDLLVHLGMFVVFVILLLLIAAGTSAVYHVGFPGPIEMVARTGFTLVASFVLFAVTYIVYPNTEKRFTLANVWRGALPAAVLFQLLTFIWPLSAAYLSTYGGILVPLLVLAAWVYSFSLILLIGAEILAISAITDAEHHGREIGPRPDGRAPEHDLLRR